MSSESLLQVQHLDLQIGRRRLIGGLDWQVRAGQSWGILGRNGVGKSSLLHHLAGLTTAPPEGISLCGQPLRQLSRREVAQQLGVLMQLPEPAIPTTLRETVLLGRAPHLGAWSFESEEDHRIVAEAIGAMGLTGLEQRLMTQLSGGERRRGEIAQLLAQQPRLAFLDEPVNHLDLAQQFAILAELRRRFSGPDQALVMVLHDLNLALRFCDHLLLLDGEGGWLAGPTTELGTAERLSDLFGHPLAAVPRGDGGFGLIPA